MAADTTETDLSRGNLAGQGQAPADWDPYKVWQEQIKKPAPEAPDEPSTGHADESWSPYEVWATLIRPRSSDE